MKISANEIIFIWFFAITLVNYLVSWWPLKWRDVLANLVIVIAVWSMTEYFFFVDVTPKTPLGQFGYIVLYGVAFASNPTGILKFIAELGQSFIKSRAQKMADQYNVNMKTEIKTDSVENIISNSPEINNKNP